MLNCDYTATDALRFFTSHRYYLQFKHVTYHRQALAPSIPSPGQAFGFEESEDGSLKKQQPPAADTSIGPAYYSVSQVR